MYKIIILRVVLYWYENWPHTHTHTKGTGGDVRGFWRMLHNEEPITGELHLMLLG